MGYVQLSQNWYIRYVHLSTSFLKSDRIGRGKQLGTQKDIHLVKLCKLWNVPPIKIGMTRDLSLQLEWEGNSRTRFSQQQQMTLHLTIHRCSLHSNQIVSLYISPDNFQSWSSKENGFFRQHGQNFVRRHISGSCSVGQFARRVQIVELKAR